MFRSPEREAFLRAALRSLRPGRARAALERELRDHMDDAAEAYRAQGLPPEEAEARAVASMGDPKALARQIRRAHWVLRRSAWMRAAPRAGRPRCSAGWLRRSWRLWR